MPATPTKTPRRKPAPPARRHLSVVEVMQLRQFEGHLMAHGATKAEAMAVSAQLPVATMAALLPWSRWLKACWQALRRSKGVRHG